MVEMIPVVETKITKVTLLEDRAQLAREGTCVVEAGRTKCRIADVAPVLCDKTLLVTVVDLAWGAVLCTIVSLVGFLAGRRLRAG